MTNIIPKKSTTITPCLGLEPEATEDGDPTSLVTFALKIKAGTPASAPIYKKQVRRFDEGSPHQWIQVLESMREIWRQNNVTSPSDRLATFRTILRGESLTAFEAAIQEGVDGGDEEEHEEIPLSLKILEEAVVAVSKTVFPHRALEHQKLWMRRDMRKPKELTSRKLASAISRINNHLHLFPGASNDDKFSESEIVELMEFSIPQEWRTKFDSLGYIPSEDTKAVVIARCKVQERSEKNFAKKPSSKITVKKAHKIASKKKFRETKKNLNGPFFCTECGENPTHNTDRCFTLKNRAAKGGNSSSNTARPFTSKKFRKEIHTLYKKQPKNKTKVLDMFASVIQSEKAIIFNKSKPSSKNRKSRTVENSDSDSESDAEMSVEVLEMIPTRAKKIVREKKKSKFKENSEFHSMESKVSKMSIDKQDSNLTDKERTFQARISALGSAPSDVNEVDSSDYNE